MRQKTLATSLLSAFLNLLICFSSRSYKLVAILLLITSINNKSAQANPQNSPLPQIAPPESAERDRQLTTSQQFSQGFSLPVAGTNQNSKVLYSNIEQSSGAKVYALQSNQNQTNSNPPEIEFAAVNNSSKQFAPVLPTSQTIEQSETELIEQMSGKAPKAGKGANTASRPAFVPPTQAQITYGSTVSTTPNLIPVNLGANTTPPLLVTAQSNSDIGLNLLSPNMGGVFSSIGQQNNLSYIPSQPPAQAYSSPTPDTTIVQSGQTLDYSAPSFPPPSGNSSAPLQTIDPPDAIPSQGRPLIRSTALNAPQTQFQGVYILQGENSSARARLSTVYPLTPRVLFGATVDLTDGNAFADSRTEGLQLNELYIATSLQELPNLRFLVGQLDLTSYFDRNSFAKDGATHFFNPVFQTNPALSTSAISSRPGVLVNWSLTDNIEAKAAAFSSARSIGDFSLDGFAGEVGLRYGNAIIRGTYVSARDAGTQDGFQEIFQVSRGNGTNGILRGDREESYGVNGEIFIPNLKLGLFGRYGRYDNRELGLGGDTYSVGFNFLDIFTRDDRLGLAYGRNLSNDKLRRQADNEIPDAAELFYDFRFLPNLRLAFTVQSLNNFSETILGFRVKTEFDVTPGNRQNR